MNGLALILLAMPRCEAAAETTPVWLQPPRLAVMTGFLKDPEVAGTLEEWAGEVGSEFDAEALVGELSEAGVSYLIFYDKWHDGLVCHATQTTGYHTRHDLLRPVAAACGKAKLPLVVYWNGCYDNNPDFAEYVTRDTKGAPILFPGAWPMRLLSLHSPFRARAVEQLREIVRDCGPVSGIWLDCYSQPWPTTDRYTAEAFEARYGAPPEQATPGQGWEFVRATMTEYLRQLRAAAAEERPGLRFTINGSALAPLYSPLGATELQSQLQFLSTEGHSFAAMDEQALAASALARPMETGNLISASWFAPTPPMLPGRARQALAECAVAWCQGANVYVAISPDDAGRYGEELEAVCGAGEWLQQRRGLLAESEPWPEIGVVFGAPAATAPGPPSLQQLWGQPVSETGAAWETTAGLVRRLQDLGYAAQALYELGDMARWPRDLSRFRVLLVPEQACLGDEHLGRLRRYVAGGGTLVVLGNGTRVEADGALRDEFGLASVLGVRYRGAATFPPGTGPVVCYVDSEYGSGWVGRNLVDGTEAGWASAASPMPHWAQVNLPAETPVATVRIVSRQGYLLRDFDVLTWTGNGWDLAETFAGNEAPIVECVLDPPRTTLGIRVHVRAETVGGQSRDLADLEEIEVLAPDGEVLSRRIPFAVQAQLGAFAPKGTADTAPQGPALVAETAGAEVLATFTDPQTSAPHPLITRHAYGRGEAFWLATGDARLLTEPRLSRLARGALGPPVVRSMPDVARHRVILRRSRAGLVVCVVDRHPALPPTPAALELDLAQAGLAGELAPAADASRAEARRSGSRLRLRLTPDPAAVLLVQ